MIKRSSMLMALIIFFFNDTATTEIYTLSLHDALPICGQDVTADLEPGVMLIEAVRKVLAAHGLTSGALTLQAGAFRSEEHTSELQSRQYLVCRLLLEKKKKNKLYNITSKS